GREVDNDSVGRAPLWVPTGFCDSVAATWARKAVPTLLDVTRSPDFSAFLPGFALEVGQDLVSARRSVLNLSLDLPKDWQLGHQARHDLEIPLHVGGNEQLSAGDQCGDNGGGELRGEDTPLFVPRLPPRIRKINVHRLHAGYGCPGAEKPAGIGARHACV